jgi:hypothetical protein
MRACWEAADTTGSLGLGQHGPVDAALVPVMAAAGSSTGRPVRTFVPVASANPADDGQYPGVAVMAATVEEAAAPPAVRPRRIPGAWSLWGDFEP